MGDAYLSPVTLPPTGPVRASRFRERAFRAPHGVSGKSAPGSLRLYGRALRGDDASSTLSRACGRVLVTFLYFNIGGRRFLCRLKAPVPSPRICGRELKNRKLDCLVINNLDPAISGQVQTVRGAFEEGDEAFPGAALKKETHIQVAVRDPECILGIFRPSRAVFLRVAHVLAWAGSTIPQAPKERQFIAWGVSPRTQERRQKMPFPAPSGRHARAVAEPSCRPDWGSEQGTGRLGTSWGLRLQATNFRRYAARENPVICSP